MPVKPTKGNLLRLRQEQDFAYEGFLLLDEKKKVLVGEILKVAQLANQLRKDFLNQTKDVMPVFYQSLISTGTSEMRSANWTIKDSYVLKILERSFMGVIYQDIDFSIPEGIRHSLIGTSYEMDILKKRMPEYMNLMFKLIETETKLWRLGAELKKLMKRVNALENIFLPQYRTTIKWIEEILEENDREDYYLRKMLKRRLSEQTGQAY